MSRKSVNPLTLSRPKSTVRAMTWKGKDANDGAVVELVMKPLSLVDSVYLPDKVSGFIVEYVTGGTATIAGKEQQVKPKPIAALGGEVVVVTEGTCRIIALLMICQVGDPDELYSFQEWAHILCIPEFQREAMKISSGMLMEELMADPDWLEEGSENPLASTAGDESASKPTSPKSSAPIPKSPIEQTAS